MLFSWASCNFSAELGKNISLQPQTHKRLISAEPKTFPMHGLHQQGKKCSRFSSWLCHAPVIPETAGKADVVLTSMQWHVTATLIVLFQPFNSVTGGNSDTDTSANAMCSHKSSVYISFFFPGKTINPIWKVLNGTSEHQQYQQMWCGSNTSRGKKCPKPLSIWTWLDLHHCRGSRKFILSSSDLGRLMRVTQVEICQLQ